MPSPAGGYSPEFKEDVVDRFVGYFGASSTLSSAAASAARAKHLAATDGRRACAEAVTAGANKV